MSHLIRIQQKKASLELWHIIFFKKKWGREKTIERLRLLVIVALNGVYVCMVMQLIFGSHMEKLFEISNLKGTHSLFNSTDMSMLVYIGYKIERYVCVSL